jgi:hypothetical protein
MDLLAPHTLTFAFMGEGYFINYSKGLFFECSSKRICNPCVASITGLQIPVLAGLKPAGARKRAWRIGEFPSPARGGGKKRVGVELNWGTSLTNVLKLVIISLDDIA